jgi:ribose 5-phosphate isomerase B
MPGTIAIGCDPNAADFARGLADHLGTLGFTVEDYGSGDPIYANTAVRVAEAVAAGKQERGVLVCGTGIGMSIAANKVPGAYAALVSDPYSAERAALSNNANIVCFGAFTLGLEVAKKLVAIWLGLRYLPGGPSDPKIQRIARYEKERDGR